jgi:hypothetical protein
MPSADEVPDWLKPGMLRRTIDPLERVFTCEGSNAPPRAGTLFLGATFPVNDEDAVISHFFQDRLPEGLGWERVAGGTPELVGQ